MFFTHCYRAHICYRVSTVLSVPSTSGFSSVLFPNSCCSSLLQNIISLACGAFHTCALTGQSTRLSLSLCRFSGPVTVLIGRAKCIHSVAFDVFVGLVTL
jgi:hypothetical protein